MVEVDGRVRHVVRDGRHVGDAARLDALDRIAVRVSEGVRVGVALVRRLELGGRAVDLSAGVDAVELRLVSAGERVGDAQHVPARADPCQRGVAVDLREAQLDPGAMLAIGTAPPVESTPPLSVTSQPHSGLAPLGRARV